MDDSQSNELECTICGNIMVDPRVLSCQHAFCLRCIFCLIKRDRGTNVVVKCPFGCEEQTTTDGDVRSLKKNHLIGSLCRRAKEKRFAAVIGPSLHSCDFCSKDNVTCRLCPRCSGTICERCDAEENFSDHGFLCCDNSKKKGASGNTAGDAPAHDSKGMVFLFTPAQAVAKAQEDIAHRLKCSVKCSKDVVPFYTPLERHNCRARVRLDGKELDVNYAIHMGHVGPETVELYDNVNFSSSELKLLSTILSCLEEVEESMESLKRSLRACQHILKLTRSPKDFTLVAHVSVAIKAQLIIERVVTESFLQRVTLMANLLGHSVIERWYQLHHNADPVQKKQLKAKIHAHLQMSALFAEAIHKKMLSLTEMSQSSFSVLEKVSQSLVASCSRSRSQLWGEPFGVTSLVSSVSAAARCIFSVTEFLKQVALSTVAEATCGSGFVGEAVERCVSTEKLLSNECDKLLGFCGSILHLHVLWNQMVIVLPDLESTDLRRFLSAVEDVAIFQPRGNIDHIVKNVVPQIQLVRVQHLSLLTQHPDHVDQHRQLQSQLCTLISQTLELFAKEHTVLVQHACEGASSYLLDCSRVLFAIFGKHQHNLTVDLSGAVTSSEGMSEAAIFRRSIDFIISALRSELRKNPSLLREKVDEIRRMQKLSQLSELFLAKGSSSSKNKSKKSPPSRSLETRLLEIYSMDEIRSLPSDPSELKMKDNAVKRFAQLVKRDAPRGVISTPVNIVSSGICCHPFYSGTFQIDDDQSREEFPFFVSGQTNVVVFASPPKTGAAWLVGKIQKTVTSLSLFYAVNATICIIAALSR